MEQMLDVRHVTRRYGQREVLHDIHFSARQGEVIALLGRNGTGKSTLMNTITGYLCQTSGQILVCGHDTLLAPMEARRHLGYLPEQPPLYPDMTVTEYLRYCCRLKNISSKAQKDEIDRVICLTGLTEYAKRLSGRLSKGYRQRLGVAQALLGHPSLLILDEPGSGLDPLQMAQMRDVIRKAGEECTVLLSSHLLSEVTSVCDRAIVLDGGYIRYDGSMEALLHGASRVLLRYRGNKKLAEALRQMPGVTRVEEAPCTEENAHACFLYHDKDVDLRPALAALVLAQGGELLELTSSTDSLEDAFIHVIGWKEDA